MEKIILPIETESGISKNPQDIPAAEGLCKGNSTKLLTFILSFFLPAIILTIVFFLHRIYPFGDNTVMTGDMEYQFVDYLAYLKTIVFGNNDFSYSFSKNLGGSMAGFSAYYYYSPLNFITLLFPNELLPVAEAVVIMLTAALSSLTMAALLLDKYGGGLWSVPFAVSYALCGFSATYFQLTMYSGNLILFPLIILGLLRLLEDPEKRWLYLIALSLAVLFNYYSGYMICIFAALFFLTETVKRGIDLKAVRSFIINSLIAVGLTSFNLIPAVLSLRGEKNSLSIGLFRTFSLKDLPAQFFSGSFSGNVSTGLPNVFCGIIILYFFIMYISERKIPLKERLADLGLIAFLLINLEINILNVVWHGFNQPIGFPFRYSYMFSFVLILCSHREVKELIALSAVEKKRVLIPFAIVFFLGLWTAVLIHGAAGRKEVLFDILIILTVAALLLMPAFSGTRKCFIVVIFIGILIDLGYNYYDVLNYYSLASLSEYQSFLKDTGEKLSVCFDDGGDDFYRIEKFFRRTNNDAMQFDYAGLSHFSSSEKKDKINFMGKLGFRNNGNWSFYNESSTDFLESFFGLRYILSQFSSTPNKYERILKDENINVFRNENAIPLIFNASPDIRDINYNGYFGDPFMLQEAIADRINGKDNRIFEKAEILSVDEHNLTRRNMDGFVRYVKDDVNSDAWLDIRIKVEDPDRNLFAYFDAPENQEAEIFKDGVSFGDYFTKYRWNIVSFHRTKKADETQIRLFLKEDNLDLINMFFYFEDRNRVGALMDEIRKNPSNMRKLTSSHLTGKITVPENGGTVLMTIPYDRGWCVFVDGKRTDIQKAVGILLSFDTTPGEHSIEMKYSPEGSLAGRIISAVMLLYVIFLLLYSKKSGGRA